MQSWNADGDRFPTWLPVGLGISTIRLSIGAEPRHGALRDALVDASA